MHKIHTSFANVSNWPHDRECRLCWYIAEWHHSHIWCIRVLYATAKLVHNIPDRKGGLCSLPTFHASSVLLRNTIDNKQTETYLNQFEGLLSIGTGVHDQYNLIAALTMRIVRIKPVKHFKSHFQ